MANFPGVLTWDSLLSLLPRDLSSLAKDTGSVERWRQVASGEMLLWLCLMYAGCGLATRCVCAYARAIGALALADTSLIYRLRRAGPFLAAVLGHLLCNADVRLRQSGSSCALRIFDGSGLVRPGIHQTDMRLHTMYVPGQGLAYFELTGASGGESLRRGRFHPQDIVMADQGLARAEDLHHVQSQNAFSLVRAYLQNIRLDVDEAGTRLHWPDALDRADRNDTATPVFVPFRGKLLAARLVVIPIPEDKAARAREKLKKRASKKQKTVSAQALRLAGYVAILTTVPQQLLSDQELLQVYRIRWQIELFFKRCKSLLNLDQIAAHDAALAQTFVLAKLIEVALNDRLTAQCRKDYDCSMASRDSRRPALSQWRLVVMVRFEFQAAIRDALVASSVDPAQRVDALDDLREGPRKRKDVSLLIAAVHRRLNTDAPDLVPLVA